jgi:hypothetical protein
LLKHEGMFALYKGTLPPLAMVGIISSLVFGIKENVRRFFQRMNGPEKPLRIW